MASSKRGKGRGWDKHLKIPEDTRLAVSLKLNDFLNRSDEKECEFPSAYGAEERCFIHRWAEKYGLKSKSRGKGFNRYVTVYKQESSTIMQLDATVSFTSNSKKAGTTLLTQFPVTNKERQDLLPISDRDRNLYGMPEIRDMSRAMGKLNNGIPQVPPTVNFAQQDPSILAKRKHLPIWSLKNEIINSIVHNQVTIISGETGSGKTTQVPQFILEHASELRYLCRVVCAEPRRLAAVSVAERIAMERDENIGQTVGFQIRLESRVSPKTLLTFCTNGVLLRSLMGGDACLSSISHIIIDEVHERDKYSDFLMTVLRDALNKYRNLRLIIMSATLDVKLFLEYFSGANMITVPGLLHPVQEHFLEDVLLEINYDSLAMQKVKNDGKPQGRAAFDELTKNLEDGCPPTVVSAAEDADVVIEETSVSVTKELSSELKTKLDQLIAKCFIKGSKDDFDEALKITFEMDCPADYMHSRTGVTLLMAAACHGNILVIEKLLEAGADVDLRATNNWTARNFAHSQGHQAACDLLESFKQTLAPVVYDSFDTMTEDSQSLSLSEEQREILSRYHFTVDDENIDFELLTELIGYIHANANDNFQGAILVFLTGYDDLITLRENLCNNPEFDLFLLHSNISSGDQKRVFNNPHPGTRKVILSTNLAETTITIDDVVYCIDSGKVKERSYESWSNVSSLKVDWISKASAAQRKGRAGRCKPGHVYRLYSRARFNHFAEFQTPEITRTPITDLCLQTKLLAPTGTAIADFIARLPQPPPFLVTRNAVQMLKTIEALDAWEDVTEIGTHLLDLPLDPRLGKTVLYGVALKCLDPILTIVCCCAHRDLFLLPSDPSMKGAAMKSRRSLSAGSFSDHMVMLRAFQLWQKAKVEGNDRAFCRKNQISSSAMEMVMGTRTQLLGQLRASGFVRAKGSGDIRDLNKYSEKWPVVKAAITAGLYPSIARYDREAKQLRSQKESKLRLHPSSVLLDALGKGDGRWSAKANVKSISKIPSEWFVFDEMTRAGHLVMVRGVTAITPVTVLLFAGPNRLPMESVSEADAGIQGNPYLEEGSDSEVEEKVEGENKMFKIDDWTIFKGEVSDVHMTLQLRQKWSAYLLRRLTTPGKPLTQVDNTVVDSIVSILCNEEQAVGLTQPAGVGERPKPFLSDILCSVGGITDSRSNASTPTSPVPYMSVPRPMLASNSNRMGNNANQFRPIVNPGFPGSANVPSQRVPGPISRPVGIPPLYQRTPYR